jgi:hypothetical protein
MGKSAYVPRLAVVYLHLTRRPYRKAYKRPSKADKARAGLAASSSAVSLKSTSSLHHSNTDKKKKVQEDFYMEVDRPSAQAAAASGSGAGKKKVGGKARLKGKLGKDRGQAEGKDYVDMYERKSGSRKY